MPDEQRGARLRVEAFDPRGRSLDPAVRPPLGGLLAATVDPDRLVAARNPILKIRRRWPWAPLVLIVPDPDPAALVQAAALAQRISARALDPTGLGFPEWRRQFLNIQNLAEEFKAMLRVQRPRLRGETTDLVDSLVGGGFAGIPFGDVVDQMGSSLRNIERRLASAHLPPPSAYHLFGTFVRAFVALAVDQKMRIAEAAEASTFAERATLVRGVRTHLGTTPSQGRRWIPWEWIAARLGLYGQL